MLLVYVVQLCTLVLCNVASLHCNPDGKFFPVGQLVAFIDNQMAPHIKFRSLGGNTMSLEDTKLGKHVMVKLVKGSLVVMDEKRFKTDTNIYKLFCIAHPMFTEMIGKED